VLTLVMVALRLSAVLPYDHSACEPNQLRILLAATAAPHIPDPPTLSFCREGPPSMGVRAADHPNWGRLAFDEVLERTSQLWRCQAPAGYAPHRHRAVRR
jgi:hypothetical protein